RTLSQRAVLPAVDGRRPPGHRRLAPPIPSRSTSRLRAVLQNLRPGFSPPLSVPAAPADRRPQAGQPRRPATRLAGPGDLRPGADAQQTALAVGPAAIPPVAEALSGRASERHRRNRH